MDNNERSVVSEQIKDGSGNTIGRITEDGKTVLGENKQVVGHISSDGRTLYQKDGRVAGHTSADGRESYDEKWKRTGSTSKDGRKYRDTSGKVLGRNKGGGLLSGGLLGAAVSLLRGQAKKEERRGNSDTSVVWEIASFVIVFFSVLIPLFVAFFGVVLLGSFVSILALYQLYSEKKRPEHFQSQSWLRNGISTRWFRKGFLARLPGTKHLREYESLVRAGWIISIPSFVCGVGLSYSGFVSRQNPDWMVNIVVGLLLLVQGVFLVSAGYHFNSVRDVTSHLSEHTVPPSPPPI